MTAATPAIPAIPEVTEALDSPATLTAEQRLRAVDTLLTDPEAIPDPLEVELYAYREQITEGNAGS